MTVSLCIAALCKGCVKSVEWNGGMEQWNGILEWVQKLFKAITMKQMHYKWWNARTLEHRQRKGWGYAAAAPPDLKITP